MSYHQPYTYTNTNSQFLIPKNVAGVWRGRGWSKTQVWTSLSLLHSIPQTVHTHLLIAHIWRWSGIVTIACKHDILKYIHFHRNLLPTTFHCCPYILPQSDPSAYDCLPWHTVCRAITSKNWGYICDYSHILLYLMYVRFVEDTPLIDTTTAMSSCHNPYSINQMPCSISHIPCSIPVLPSLPQSTLVLPYQFLGATSVARAKVWVKRGLLSWLLYVQ